MADAPAVDAVVKQFLDEHGHQSAFTTTTGWQRLKYLFWIVQAFILFQYDWKIFFTIITGVLGIFYLATISYKLLTVFLSVVWPGEMKIPQKEITELDDENLPVYTILLPVYKEAAVVDKIVAHLVEPKSGKVERLTERETQVLAFIAQGAANKEIAYRLHITERTVKAHVTSIFNKLGVNSRAEAVAVAMRTGMLPTQPSE